MADTHSSLETALSAIRKLWEAHWLCAMCAAILNSPLHATFAYRNTAREIRDAAYDSSHMCFLIHESFLPGRREASQPSSAVGLDGP